MALSDQGSGDAIDGIPVIADGGVDVVAFDVAVDHKNRHLGCGLADVVGLRSARAVARVGGTHEDQCVDPFGEQHLDMGLFTLELEAGAGEDAFIAVPVQHDFEEGDGGRHVPVGNIRHEDTHGVHGVEAEPLREDIGCVARVFDDAQDLFFCFVTDLIGAVDDTGNRGDRDAGHSGDVVDVHSAFPRAGCLCILHFAKFGQHRLSFCTLYVTH